MSTGVEFATTRRPLTDGEIQPTGIPSGLLSCRVEKLRPHPSYARHKLSVQTASYTHLEQIGELAFQHPLTITRDRIIIDGYARWELAKRQGRPILQCVEHDLDEHQALEWLIQAHRTWNGLSDFVRIELAFDLEPQFRDKALLNSRHAGRLKGLSNLTEAEKVNTRTEIARVADVSVGNVHKVKYILDHGCPSMKEAARTGEISINLAEKWCHETEPKQQENLRLMRIERGIRKKARHLIAVHVALGKVSKPDQQVIRLEDFLRLIHHLSIIQPEQSSELASIEVRFVHGGGPVLVPEELFSFFRSQPEALVDAR